MYAESKRRHGEISASRSHVTPDNESDVMAADQGTEDRDEEMIEAGSNVSQGAGGRLSQQVRTNTCWRAHPPRKGRTK